MEQLEYTVIRSSRRTAAIQIVNGRVLVRCPYGTGDAWIQAFVRAKEGWVRKHLQTAVPVERFTEQALSELKKQAKSVIVERVAALAGQMGISYGTVTIRAQRTRWGSCTARGDLNFNCLLMLVPADVRDYVIVHELCHRKQMNHSRAFWKLVEERIPAYREKRAWLKHHGKQLIDRL